MTNYLEHKVSEGELAAIFNNHIDRNVFISEYPYFGSDENDDFYKDFIESSLSNAKSSIFEDGVELSIATNYFKDSFLYEIKKIIFSRKHESIKLACLDWMFYFFKKIPQEEFFQINNYGLTHFSSNLLKVQCALNLLLIDPKKDFTKKLILLLINSNKAYAFYRILNALDSVAILNQFDISNFNTIKKKLLTKTDISESQKKEIANRLDKLSKR